MFTISGVTHTLTQEMMVLIAALAAFVLGIVTITVDVVRRNKRRREAESRPIDTSIFQNLAPGETIPVEEEPEPPAGEVTASEQVDAESPAPEAGPVAHDLAQEPEAFETAAPEAFETAAPATEAAAYESEPVVAEPAAEPIVEHGEFGSAEPEAEPIAFAPAAFTPAASIPHPQPILVCDAFGAGFGSKIVLADVTLQVLDQGITTLMGPVGTGKSTLLRALSGMLSQSGLFKSWGAAWFRGAPVGPDNRPALVAQRIQLIQRSALENLTFHLRDRTSGLSVEQQHDWASQWLEQAGAGDVIALLDRPFMELDQLSQRIITILREAAAEPALLLIDEPTTGLSEADAGVLLNMLERLAGFTPLLVALQNHKHARKISNQIILLAGGQVQASCEAEVFFTAPPNPAVAQFIATGTCAVPPPDASAIRQPADPAGPPPLTAATLAAIKDEIRNALAVEMMPHPAETQPEPHTFEPAAEHDAFLAEPAAEPEPEAYQPELDVTEMDAVAPAPDAEPVLSEPDTFEPAAEHDAFPAEPAAEPALETEAHEPHPGPIEMDTATPEPEAEPVLSEPTEQPEPYTSEPAAAEHAAILTEPAEAPALEQMDAAALEPEAEPVLREPAPEPETDAFEQAATESETSVEHTSLVAEPAVEPRPEPELLEPVADEIEAALPEPEAETVPHDSTPDAFEPAPPETEAGEPEPVLAEPAAEPVLESYEFEAAEPVLDEPAPEAETVLESTAHIFEPITIDAEPEPVEGDAEPVTAERMSAPIAYAPQPAEPAIIDMDAFPAEEPAAHADLGEPSTLDELPMISLGAQMMQTAPLPPRSAAAQMAASGASDAQNERAAATRYPGSGTAGPRGFVWIEDGRLAATPMPGISAPVDQDLAMLKNAGITALITLTEQNFPQQILAEHGLRNVHFPIADRQAPTAGETDVLVNQMHDMLNKGEVLAVHCLAGLGRTGTILAAYMVKEKGMSAQAALNQIRHFNRQFVQTDDQEDFLVEYEVQQEQTDLLNRAAGMSRLT